MDTYDSDSSGVEDGDFTETSVLLGYASKEATEDFISHLGGHPTWLDPSVPPPESLAKCKVCRDLMSLLLQLNGDLPEHFPDDERRLYILGCRRKTCNRKNGSIRVLRSIRRHKAPQISKTAAAAATAAATTTTTSGSARPTERLGDSLFGVRPSPTQANNDKANPFSTATTLPSSPPSAGTERPNPFAPLPSPSTLAAKPPQKPTEEDLPATFAEKARIASSTTTTSPTTPLEAQPPPPPSEPWPPESRFPSPYPVSYLDADYETLSRPSTPTTNVPASHISSSSLFDEDDSSASVAGFNNKDTFESSLDKPFLKFSNRLGHNPEQVIRYEFKGKPLLYSTTDAVGKMLAPRQNTGVSSSGMPRCGNCSSERVFEVQLVPHAITVLEEDEHGAGLGEEGMVWGTIIIGVCGKDCPEKGKEIGSVGYLEEWAGVQWEEQVVRK